MDQFDLFGEVHMVAGSERPERCMAGPEVAHEVLDAVFRCCVTTDGRHKHDAEFGPKHLSVLKHLQAQDFVQPGKGAKRGWFVLTPRGREQLQRWDALVALPASSRGRGGQGDD